MGGIVMRKVKNYPEEFKTKVVLEILREEESISEIGSKYQIAPSTLRGWKEQFLQNASLAFNPNKVVCEYKDRIRELNKEKEALYKELGKVTAQLSWAKKKSEEVGLSIKEISD